MSIPAAQVFFAGKVRSDWDAVLQQPIKKTYRNTIEGLNNMPKRGLCGMCTDKFLRVLVDEMLDKVRRLDNSSVK